MLGNPCIGTDFSLDTIVTKQFHLQFYMLLIIFLRGNLYEHILIKATCSSKFSYKIQLGSLMLPKHLFIYLIWLLTLEFSIELRLICAGCLKSGYFV